MLKKKQEEQPSVAPGVDDREELELDATKEDIQSGNYTEVTTLSLDEADPS
ncbi:hypothetical protein [Pseudalkalibacillus caeni]|uniref:hypothetical protein n=1 Tax=Exobacillus caeni TaxID=2574798 RepID=UPI0014858A7A|nr:hypothetical protein [Pseudalkalibacillus caeni]